MKVNWKKFNRKVHYWGSIICAIPIGIIIITGTILILKKQIEWVQPPTIKGKGITPLVSFAEIFDASRKVQQANIQSWEDIDRLDIRPSKGVIKVRGKNQWEIQIDHQSLKILNIAYRRSDFIESIHDGSYFHDNVKLFVFFPSAILLLILWGTGLYLFFKTYFSKRNVKIKRASLET
ncbi:MAG: hypothetical protein CL866_00485 [Cycloclasticus sp.]|nr:hypothetical protein [Cycloclasticus sp.]MBG95334.1 hypothetical protein [Cycloclasticus sp.]HAI97887.1 hypothetical protein [Methylococcaceae bacterium]